MPQSIDTLGGLLTDGSGRLLVLGGHGNSGCYLTGVGEPQIVDFANNDGWFDDVSDGPVTAILKYWDEDDLEHRYLQVDEPSWVVVGYPRFAPQIVDIVTLDDVVYDVSVREFAYDTYLYGEAPWQPRAIDPENPDPLRLWRVADKSYNPGYYPYFYRDIWPILLRPFQMQWVTDFLQISHDAHDTGPRGDFDISMISVPPTPKRGPVPRRAPVHLAGAAQAGGGERLHQHHRAGRGQDLRPRADAAAVRRQPDLEHPAVEVPAPDRHACSSCWGSGRKGSSSTSGTRRSPTPRWASRASAGSRSTAA